MKRLKSVGFCIGIIIACVGCSSNTTNNTSVRTTENFNIESALSSEMTEGKYQNYSHVVPEAKTVYFSSLKEMEDYSNIIVSAKREKGEKSVIEKNDNNVYSTYSFSHVLVEKVYKDDDQSGRKLEGKEITVLENEAVDEETKTVYHVGDYNMMVPGCEYLLFLKECELNGETYYVASGVNCGTISMDVDGRDFVRGEKDEKDPAFDDYRDLWEAAKAKYLQ